jgi:hypothetical protein
MHYDALSLQSIIQSPFILQKLKDLGELLIGGLIDTFGLAEKVPPITIAQIIIFWCQGC